MTGHTVIRLRPFDEVGGSPAPGHRVEVPPLAVAIDVGSSSIRAGVYDGRGRPIPGTHVRTEHALVFSKNGRKSVAADELVESVSTTLDLLEGTAGRWLGSVVAVGMTCFLHSIVGLDARGRPVTPLLSWADTSSGASAAAVRSRINANAARQRTGVPIHGSYWPAKIESLRSATEPPADRWVGFSDFLIERFTGVSVMTRSMASGTGLLNRFSGSWDTEFLDALALSPTALPGLVDDRSPLPPLRPEYARRWPRLAAAPWYGAWGDAACGTVGLSCTSPTSAALMIGTSGAMRVLLPGTLPTVPDGLFAYGLLDRTLVGGQLSEGGAVAAWVSRLTGRSLRALERGASALLADDHGLTILPWLAGERSLGYRDEAVGVIEGLTLTTDPAALYRAMIEAISLYVARVDARLTSIVGASPRIVASGRALLSSPLWLQVLADSLGRQIGIARVHEASSRGAAVLALLSSGTLDTIDDVPELVVRVVAPDPMAHERYRAAMRRQDGLDQRVLR